MFSLATSQIIAVVDKRNTLLAEQQSCLRRLSFLISLDFFVPHVTAKTKPNHDWENGSIWNI